MTTIHSTIIRSSWPGTSPFLKRYRRDDALLLWLLLALPFSLPWIFWGALLLFVVSYPWLPVLWRARQRLIIAAGLLLGVPLALVTLPVWLSGESLLAATALIAVLKRAEQQSKRDRLVLLVAVFITNVLNLVYWNNLPALLHLLGLMLLMLTLMRYESARIQGSSRFNQWVLVLWSLPLATLLFLFLPRIPGPLWDVGLAFGLPISVYQQTLSIAPAPGGGNQNEPLASLQAAQQVVLVAEFSGAVPLKSDLYWRGAVSYGYQDGEWTDSLAGTRRADRLASAWRDMSQYQLLIQTSQPAVSYQIKVAPHQQYWLYAPDMPEHNVQESFISADNQLLAIRPLHDEFSYSASSFLEAGFKPDTPPAVAQSELPETEDARIRQTARQWLQDFERGNTEHGQATAIQERLLSFLAAPPAWFGATPPYSAERLQRWVGISMLLLQRAGLPARMVSGYRGGDLIALSDVVVVRQKHRHHWLELWDAERGWQRLEIKDILQLQSNHVTEKSERASTPDSPAKQMSAASPQQPKTKTNDATATQSWLKRVESWLRDYAPEAQVDADPLSDSVASKSGLQWWLPVACVLGWLLLLLIHRRYRQRPSLMEQSWQQLREGLSKQGFTLLDWQCPSLLLNQLHEQPPAWAEAAKRLIQVYLHYQYASCFAGQPQTITPKTYQAQVKRFNQALKALGPTKQQHSAQVERSVQPE